jgi:hypothetical protein
MKLKYNINSEGLITEIGYLNNYLYEVDESTPFGLNDAFLYKKNVITGDWDHINIKQDYPYEGRNIRVELTNEQITDILLNEQTRPIIEWAYHLPNQKTESGIILWFIDFANDLMSEADTEALLLSLGAIITRNSI